MTSPESFPGAGPAPAEVATDARRAALAHRLGNLLLDESRPEGEQQYHQHGGDSLTLENLEQLALVAPEVAEYDRLDKTLEKEKALIEAHEDAQPHIQTAEERRAPEPHVYTNPVSRFLKEGKNAAPGMGVMVADGISVAPIARGARWAVRGQFVERRQSRAAKKAEEDAIEAQMPEARAAVIKAIHEDASLSAKQKDELLSDGEKIDKRALHYISDAKGKAKRERAANDKVVQGHTDRLIRRAYADKGKEFLRQRMTGHDGLHQGAIDPSDLLSLSEEYRDALVQSLSEERTRKKARGHDRAAHEEAAIIIAGEPLTHDDYAYLAKMMGEGVPKAIADEEKRLGRRLTRGELNSATIAAREQSVRAYLGVEDIPEEDLRKIIDTARATRAPREPKDSSREKPSTERHSVDAMVAAMSDDEKQHYLDIDAEVMAAISAEHDKGHKLSSDDNRRIRNEVYRHYFPSLDDRQAAQILEIIKALKK